LFIRHRVRIVSVKGKDCALYLVQIKGLFGWRICTSRVYGKGGKEYVDLPAIFSKFEDAQAYILEKLDPRFKG
jgi:hypothetical protein